MNHLTHESQLIDRLLVVPPTIYIPDDVDTFHSQPREEQLDQLSTINAMYRPHVNERFFERGGAYWVAVGIPTGEVLATGLHDEEMPTTISEIKTLAQQAVTRCIPAMFVRPIVDHPGRG